MQLTPFDDEARRLTALARQHLGPDVGERWAEMLAPGTRLRARPPEAKAGWFRRGSTHPPRSVGWLGGLPRLAAGTDWPVWEGNGPLAHVATLDCAHLYPTLPRALCDAGFPEAGSLSFFYFDGAIDGGAEVVGALFGNDDDGSRVLYTPAGLRIAELQPPAPLAPYRRVDLVAEPILTWATWERPELWDGNGKPPAGWDELFPVLDELRQTRPGPAHQVGGNPEPVQGPVEVEVSYGRQSGGGLRPLDWRASPVVERAREWMLLAQIDTDADAGFMWGDCGMLYFMVRPADLAARDFSQVAFTWQCS